MTGREVEVVVHDDAPTLAREVAGEVLALIERVQAEGREPHVALTGGSIADALHRELARQSAASDADWSRVHLWWGDERFVPTDSPDRNAGQAAAALLDHVPVDPAHVHVMPASDEVADVEAGAAAYADEVRAVGAGEFDLVMLGVGPDGHVASLFPGFPQLDVDDRIAVGVTGSPKPPPQRISLTFPALNRARAVWFLVSGADKAPAVRRSQPDRSHPAADPSHPAGEKPHPAGDQSHPAAEESLPAARVHGHEQTVWHVDRAAGSMLSP